MCGVHLPLTLGYIFKVIQPWLCYKGLYFSCDQDALRILLFGHLSVYASTSITFFTMFLSLYQPEIPKVITIAKSDIHAKGQCQRSKVKITEVKFGHSQYVTPVWIHKWLRNHAQSLKWCRRDALCFSMSSVKILGHTVKKSTVFNPNWAFLDNRWHFKVTHVEKLIWISFGITRLVAAIKSLTFALLLMHAYWCFCPSLKSTDIKNSTH